MGKRVKFQLITLCVALCSLTLSAQEKRVQPNGLNLGAGYLLTNSIYSGVGQKGIAIPSIGFKYNNFYIRGLKLGYSFFSSEKFKSNFVVDANYFSGELEENDSTLLTGIKKRKGTAKAGLDFKYKISYLSLRTGILHDVLGLNKGYEARVSIGSAIPINIIFKSLPFTLLGVTYGGRYRDSKFNNYYFGVSKEEELNSRISYSTEGSFNPFLLCFLRMKLSSFISIVSFYNFEWLPNEIKNSSIVSESNKSSFALFLNFKVF